MKISTKPISSPGRTDEFPQPLIMFPRSKSSRGSRSRAHPMFLGKINKNESVQEPSSPKVTCIGQVRVRKAKSKQLATRSTNVRRCKWLRKLKPRNMLLFRFGCGKKPEILKGSKNIDTSHKHECKKHEGKDVTRHGNDVLVQEPPPKNAFLLTRSRSLPYRSSSLASKIWESSTMKETKNDENEGINENIGKENEGSVNRIEEFQAKSLNLSRCKSEPSRTSDKLFMGIL